MKSLCYFVITQTIGSEQMNICKYGYKELINERDIHPVNCFTMNILKRMNNNIKVMEYTTSMI